MNNNTWRDLFMHSCIHNWFLFIHCYVVVMAMRGTAKLVKRHLLLSYESLSSVAVCWRPSQLPAAAGWAPATSFTLSYLFFPPPQMTAIFQWLLQLYGLCSISYICICMWFMWCGSEFGEGTRLQFPQPPLWPHSCCWSWYLAAAVESRSPAECGSARTRGTAQRDCGRLPGRSYSYSRLLPSTTYAVDYTLFSSSWITVFSWITFSTFWARNDVMYSCLPISFHFILLFVS